MAATRSTARVSGSYLQPARRPVLGTSTLCVLPRTAKHLPSLDASGFPLAGKVRTWHGTTTSLSSPVLSSKRLSPVKGPRKRALEAVKNKKIKAKKPLILRWKDVIEWRFKELWPLWSHIFNLVPGRAIEVAQGLASRKGDQSGREYLMDLLRGRSPGTLSSRARGFLTYAAWLGQRWPEPRAFPEDGERRSSLLYEEVMVDWY